MKNGLIYTIIDWTIEKLKWLNLVESFKWTAKRIYPADSLLASRLGVDIFIILKWIAVIVLWLCQVNNEFVNLIIWYLIFTNLYTYFYHHTWTKDLDKGNFSIERVKRRFLNLLLAISFNVFCFAYLIRFPFSANYEWTNHIATSKHAILHSVANSLTVSFDSVKTVSQVGQTLNVIETITMFVFLTIILSNSIPQTKND